MSVMFLRDRLLGEFGFIDSETASVVIDMILGELIATMTRGERVEIKGFGSFFIRKRVGYKVYNPICKKDIDIEERMVVHFRASDIMLKALSG